MTGVPAPARADFLYDGDCAFCSSCARFIGRRIPTYARVEPWQFADLDSLGLTAAECDDAVQWVAVDAAGTRTTAAGPAAIARLLGSSGRFWRGLGRGLGTRAALAVAWPVYRWISRNRHRMPGGTATCSLPADRREGPAAPRG